MVDLQTVGVLMTGVSVTVAAVYYMFTLRINMKTQQLALKSQELALKAQQQSQETRQAQLYMQIYQTFTSPQLLDSEYKLYSIEFKNSDDWKKLLKSREDYSAFIFYGSWFEGLGILVKDKLIDIRVPAELTSGALVFYWEKYRDGIIDCRTKLNWPRFFVEVEYLYDRLMEYGRAHPELGLASPRFE